MWYVMWWPYILLLLLLALGATCHHRQRRNLPWVRAVRKAIQGTMDVRPRDLPVEILPHLLLGDKRSASDPALLKVFGITHVCNAGGRAGQQADDVLASYAAANIELLHLDAEDEEGYPMLPLHRDRAAAFFARAKAASGRVLVHCVAGINRSGVLAASELMVHERLPVVEAVRRIKAIRGTVLWNESFQAQLVVLARAEGLLGSAPSAEDQAFGPPRAKRKNAAHALKGL